MWESVEAVFGYHFHAELVESSRRSQRQVDFRRSIGFKSIPKNSRAAESKQHQRAIALESMRTSHCSKRSAAEFKRVSTVYKTDSPRTTHRPDRLGVVHE